ncbi:amidohydrolase family protein [Flammeovirga pacifica]|uniref:Peptidase M19 n=1 Tax=Flammeovirga pacifica TaxID=915059 RepID=A0A1S1YSQ1_FLAPC|nr:hypothetical protein [Flammeovirga pacifica]OHX64050.1 hypothetical protein NH26_20795 [Flammeovirga pacifica]
MRKYADLHLHLALKHLVNKGEKGRANIWDRIPYDTKINKPNRASSDRYDQSDLTSLVENNVKIAVIALHPVEIIAKKSWENRLIGKFIFGFELERLKKWTIDKVNGFSLMNKELAVITGDEGDINTAEILNSTLRNKNLQAKIACTREDILNEEETKLILTIEGAHALSNLPYDASGDELKKEVLKNLQFLQFKRNLPIFALTLCHFANNRMFKQSWALPLPRIVNILPITAKNELQPPKENFNNVGLAVLNQCLNQPLDKRILIDLKHLHIDARKEFYELHIRNEDGSYKAPILASHCGVSGQATFENAGAVPNIKREGKKKKYQRFNPWAINFCDEELKYIMASKGLFGISLDQRILGTANDEYYRNIECHLKTTYTKEVWKKFTKKVRITYIHAAMFLDNLLYAVHKMGKVEAWDIVCIGSDFDGIIDPIDCCPTVAYFTSFEDLLISDFDKLRYEKGDIFIPEGYSIKELIRKVFYENINEFMRNNIHWSPGSIENLLI